MDPLGYSASDQQTEAFRSECCLAMDHLLNAFGFVSEHDEAYARLRLAVQTLALALDAVRVENHEKQPSRKLRIQA